MASTEQSRLAKELFVMDSSRTLSAIGSEMNISGEWVRKLLLNEGMSVRKYRGIKYDKERICPICGGVKSPGANKCSICLKKERNVTFVCEVCGNEFTRYKSQVRNKKNEPRFCGKVCQGRWLGNTYGIARAKD